MELRPSHIPEWYREALGSGRPTWGGLWMLWAAGTLGHKATAPHVPLAGVDQVLNNLESPCKKKYTTSLLQVL